MEDGSSIQNVLDLGEFNDDLVNLHGGPITIKTEIIENVDMTPTDENEMPQAEENEMASMTDTTMTSMQESMQEPTEEPSKSAGAKETTQGKRRQFKPKVFHVFSVLHTYIGNTSSVIRFGKKLTLSFKILGEFQMTNFLKIYPSDRTKYVQ